MSRLLVLGLSALLVARIVVGGTNPARFALFSGTAGLTLNLGIFGLFFGFAVLRGIQRLPLIGLGAMGYGLLALIIGGVVYATQVEYAHPAWYVVWELIAGFLLYWLTRQLADEPAMGDGLLRIVLASVVSSTMLAAGKPLGFPVVESIAEPPPQLLGLLILVIPLGLLLIVYGWLARGWSRLIVLPVALMATALLMLANQSLTMQPEPLQWPLWLLGLCTLPIVGLLLAMVPSRIPPAIEELPTERWDLYLGGMSGLLFGFFLLATDKPRLTGTTSMIDAGMVAGVRAMFWFGAVALFEGVSLRGRAVTATLLSGTLAVTAASFFLTGMINLAVWQPWLVWAALTVNRLHPVSPVTAPVGIVRAWWLAPIATVVFFAFTLNALSPARQTAAALHRARVLFPEFEDRLVVMKRTQARLRVQAAQAAESYLVLNIVRPLTAASQYDPGNAPLLRELLVRVRDQWELAVLLGSIPGTAAKKAQQETVELSVQLEDLMQRIATVEPNNSDGHELIFDTMLTFIRTSKSNRGKRFARAEEAMNQVIALDPQRELDLRFRMLEGRFGVNDFEQLNEGIQECIRLLRREQALSAEGQKLTDVQRAQVMKWLGDPNQALLDALMME